MPYNRENHYWRLLAENLEAHGVVVGECGTLKALAAQRKRRDPTPDVLHMHWMPRFEWTGAGVRRIPMFLCHLSTLWRQGQRFVWTAHDLYHPEVIWRAADRWMTRLAIPFFSRVVVHTELAKRIVCREFKVRDPERVTVIRHGHYIDSYPNSISREQARRDLGLHSDDLVFGFLGHLRPYKGLNDLLDAFAKLDIPRRRLVIAGKPLHAPMIRELEARIRDDDRVILRAGFVPDDKVQVYLNAADVMVIPYHQSLTSGALVLAMSFGRACVAASVGSIPEMIDAGGILYDSGRADGLREALQSSYTRRDRLASMGAANLSRARSWDWCAIARATAAVYAEAVGRAPSRVEARIAG